MQNKRKITTAIVASVVAVALLLGGTFAWQSINQTALNEASDVINPGGRLHDDFDGSNKDVYVENFADEDIFARIQLSEYFAIIANYGKDGAETKTDIAGTATLTDGKITNPEYVIHYFDQDNATDKYWTWDTDGSTVFMPTFNLNKDSLVADINGTYDDAIGGISNRDDEQYSNYVDYTLPENSTKTDTEIYDGDTDMDDEVGTNFDALQTYIDAGDIVTVPDQEHTAKETGNGTLISMADWLAMVDAAGGYNVADHGNYWVYDTDGWVYWSAPIAPDTATGLLLDGIELNGVMDDTWYYAINVVAQFVTADDVGQNDNTGFYDTTNGSAPTESAESLLDLIGVEMIGELTISASSVAAPRGETVQFTATAEDGTEVSGLDWTVTAGTTSTFAARTIAETSIDSTGLLSVATDEAATVLTVSASGKYTDSEGKTKDVTGSVDIEVIPGNIETTDDIAYPAYTIFTDDGSGAGTYTMTMVRAADEPAVGDYYNCQPIAEVLPMTENGYDTHPWYWSDASLRGKVTSVYAANKIVAATSWIYAFDEDFAKLESVDLTKVDFSNTTNLRGFFMSVSSLKEVKLSETFGVNATNIEVIFNGCSSLTTLDLPDGFGSKATDLYGAFRETGLTELILPDGFGDSLNDADGYELMFFGSRNLKSIILPEGFGQNAKKFVNAFAECTSLESVNLPSDLTVDGGSVSYMFENCSNLTLDCSGWKITNSNHAGFNTNAPGVIPPTWG